MTDTVSGDIVAIATVLRAKGDGELATKLEVAAVKVRRLEHSLDEITRESFDAMEAMARQVSEARGSLRVFEGGVQ